MDGCSLVAVLIRESIDGKEKKIYKTNLEKVTPSIAREANKLDNEIKTKIQQIEREAKKNHLLDLKSKKTGVTKLYHFVGKEIRQFIDELKLSKGDKPFVWQAINYHSQYLKTSESEAGRLKRDPVTSQWTYFYKLGEYDWEDVKEYDWTQWVEIFDSKLTTNDKRIVFWLIEKKKNLFESGSLQNWFRALIKEVRFYLKDYDTTVLSEKELYSELDVAFKNFSENYND